MQFRDEAIAAANVAIEEIVNDDFMTLPTATTVPVDIDRDGTNEHTVDVPPPTCASWRVIPSSELNVSNPADLPCFLGGAATASGLGGVAGTDSFCADTLWQVRAIVAPTAGGAAATGASVTINQGIRKRMNVTMARNSCN
jgi:hypothetical protein